MALIALTLKKTSDDPRQHGLSPLYLVAGSFSYEAAHDGNGTRVWQGPSAFQYAERCPSDGTMDAGVTDEHVWIVEEDVVVITGLLHRAGVRTYSGAALPLGQAQMEAQAKTVPPLVIDPEEERGRETYIAADRFRCYLRDWGAPDRFLGTALWSLLFGSSPEPGFRGAWVIKTPQMQRFLWQWESPGGEWARGVVVYLAGDPHPFRLVRCRFDGVSEGEADKPEAQPAEPEAQPDASAFAAFTFAVKSADPFVETNWFAFSVALARTKDASPKRELFALATKCRTPLDGFEAVYRSAADDDSYVCLAWEYTDDTQGWQARGSLIAIGHGAESAQLILTACKFYEGNGAAEVLNG